MAKWTKSAKQTNNSQPLIAVNKKVTAAEFNELTGIINTNFDLTVAPADQVYGRQGENWVGIPSGGGGGIDPADIVNYFNTDPDDATKVAGADAVYTLFQILASDDVNYDTLQEIVTFIKTIDTDGELLAIFNTAIGNSDWQIKYTDAEARIAQALVQRTGTVIAFDRPASYGDVTAETGNITFDFTNAISGTAQVLRINTATKPTLPASKNLLAGKFVPSVDNFYYFTAIFISGSTWRVDVTVSQNNTW